MVTIFLPAAALAGNEQERVATPSICTVQAPHCAMPQPYLVPVMPSVSRSTQSSGVRGSALAWTDFPLTLITAMAGLLIRALSRKRETLSCGARAAKRHSDDPRHRV